MKLAQFLVSAIAGTLALDSAAHGASAPAAELHRPAGIARGDVLAAARAFEATMSSDGVLGVTELRQACYRQMLKNRSWRQLDRCVTIEYMAEALSALYGDDPIYPRWERWAKRLGGNHAILVARVRQIERLIPWDALFTDEDAKSPLRPDGRRLR